MDLDRIPSHRAASTRGKSYSCPVRSCLDSDADYPNFWVVEYPAALANVNGDQSRRGFPEVAVS